MCPLFGTLVNSLCHSCTAAQRMHNAICGEYGTLHEFACHPCAGANANLLCMVPTLFQFHKMCVSPKLPDQSLPNLTCIFRGTRRRDTGDVDRKDCRSVRIIFETIYWNRVRYLHKRGGTCEPKTENIRRGALRRGHAPQRLRREACSSFGWVKVVLSGDRTIKIGL